MSSPLFPLREDSGASRLVAKSEADLQQAGNQPQSAGAWKREMERAQLDTWFKPRQAVSRNDGRPEGAGVQTPLNSGGPRPASPNAVKPGGRMASLSLAASGPAPNRERGIQAVTLMAAQAPKPEAGRIAATDIRAASLALALAGVSRLKVVNLAPAVDPGDMMVDALNVSSGLPSPSEEVDPDPQVIRLHAEWRGHDVAVWLGIDARADTVEEQLAQLLPHIRDCLQGQRSRLIKLVCNGKTVFEVSSSLIPAFPYFTQPKELP